MAAPRELISTWLISSIAINGSKQLRYYSCTSELHNKNPDDRFTQYTFAAQCSTKERRDLRAEPSERCTGSSPGGAHPAEQPQHTALAPLDHCMGPRKPDLQTQAGPM